MDKVAGSNNDEFYTPEYAIEPILKYLKPNSLIWCPFDTEDSNYYKVLTKQGHRVIATHLDMGVDFFAVNPKTVLTQGILPDRIIFEKIEK